MPFELATPRILFGARVIEKVPSLAAEMGRHAFLVTDPAADFAASLREPLKKEGVQCSAFGVTGEPTTDSVAAGVQRARNKNCDLVIGLGGGSVIDTAKAIAALLTNPGDLLDYLEVIGAGRSIREAPAPCIAIPTTAGTGAEVTRNSVIGSKKHGVKVSMRSPLMLPRLAVVDPTLTHSMPPSVTASTGLDALTQVLEPFVSAKANPITDGFCREGLTRAARSLQRAFENGSDAQAREDMALASLLGGLALANAGLGAVHGFAAPLGGMFPAPHGVICARLLPHVMETNVRALHERAPTSPALARYDEVARIVTGKPGARAADGVEWVRALCATLKIPPLGPFGLNEDDFSSVVEKALRASSMKGNPIVLTDEELTAILRKSV